jgi:hypothetical protein
VDNRTDEDLLVAIAAGPGALPEFYRRHVAKIVGVGSRRFDEPEDVADFVATVFLEVMESAGGSTRAVVGPWPGCTGLLPTLRLGSYDNALGLPTRRAG